MYLFRMFIIFVLACCMSFGTATASAAFPEKPVTLVVPFEPGGANDAVGRIIAEGLGKELHQNVVVENRPGAGGTIGSMMVASAKADGYTLLLVSAAHAISSSIYAKLNYDPIKSFTPISQLTSAPYILVVNHDLPVNSVPELIAFAKAKPGTINYASSGKGSAPHLAAAMFANLEDLDMMHISYKGGGPALIGVMRGDITMYFSSYSSAVPLLRSNKIRAIGVTTATRSPTLPNIPSIAEEGIPNFDLKGWYGVVAPARTPKAVVTQLNKALAKVLANSEVRSQLLSQGEQPVGSSVDNFSDFIETEVHKYADIARSAKIVPE